MRTMKKAMVIILAAVVLGGVTAAFLSRGRIRAIAEAKMRAVRLPKAQTAEELEAQNAKRKTQSNDTIISVPSYEPTTTDVQSAAKSASGAPGPFSNLLLKKSLYPEVNLAVPFTSQAPYRQWVMPYKEFCEEASTVMVNGFFKGKTKFSRDEADALLKKVQQWEVERFGHWEDTNAEETATILRDYFGYQHVRIMENPTVEALKAELSQGHPIIIPAAGRQLGNPYFTPPGPLYHMLVLKGYTDKEFIVNDPGINRGEHYTYSFATIMDAMHDWNAGDVEHGRKVAIVVEP